MKNQQNDKRMKFSLENKTAVVSGGGSGIGRAICQTLAEHGATVHILEHNVANGDQTVKTIKSKGGTAFGHQCDVSKGDMVKKVFGHIADQGPIDILVNNAGIAHVGNLEQTEESDMDRLYEVNVKGVYNCMHACVGHMKAKGGVIINMASIASSVGIQDRFAYSMTKGAVLTMTYSVAKDYLGHGIRCNSISPGRIHTPFVDGFIKKNYPGKEREMFDKLSRTQPIGRPSSNWMPGISFPFLPNRINFIYVLVLNFHVHLFGPQSVNRSI